MMSYQTVIYNELNNPIYLSRNITVVSNTNQLIMHLSEGLPPYPDSDCNCLIIYFIAEVLLPDEKKFIIRESDTPGCITVDIARKAAKQTPQPLDSLDDLTGHA